MSNVVRVVSCKIDKAIFGYGFIQAADRALVGLSGGKDSVTLAHQLALKARASSNPFEVAAVHIRTEYVDLEGVDHLRELASSVNLPFEQMEILVTDRLKPGKRMNCYWCCTQRRTELLRHAQANAFSLIELEEHAEGISETPVTSITPKAEDIGVFPGLRPRWHIPQQS